MSNYILAELTNEPTFCGHCGTTAPMSIAWEGSHTTKDMVQSEAHFVTEEAWVEFYYTWQVLICLSCNEPSFIEHYTCSEELDYTPEGHEYNPVHTQLLYPQPQTKLSHLPLAISKSYQEAIKSLPTRSKSFPMFARQTIEFLCKDRGAKGRNLEQMIDDLTSRGEIPQKLADMAHGLRYFGNITVHEPSREISKEDVDLLHAICAAILFYVYEVPIMLQRIQERTNHIRDEALSEGEN